MTRHAKARWVMIGGGGLAVAGIAITTALVLGSPDAAGAGPSVTGAEYQTDSSASAVQIRTESSSPASPPPYSAPTPDEVGRLPEARYDAVIPGLMDESESVAPVPVTASARAPALSPTPPRPAPAPADGVGRHPTTAYSLLADAPLYGVDRMTPVARLAAVNFLGEPTVVVPVASDGEWTRVLTPARQQLPSVAGGDAAAQSSGWLRTDALVHPLPLAERIVVSVSAQSLTIVSGDEVVSTFDVGVGTPNTPTPQGVTGYLQARYLDPAQGQSEHRVQLTSLHSSAADEPYGGTDGGLIGVHHSPEAAGTVSHGCIRLSDAAIRAIDALPLGTTFTVVE